MKPTRAKLASLMVSIFFAIPTIVSPIAFAGAKDGGGGSYERLLINAASEIDFQKVRIKRPLDKQHEDDYYRNKFLAGAEAGLLDLIDFKQKNIPFRKGAGTYMWDLCGLGNSFEYCSRSYADAIPPFYIDQALIDRYKSIVKMLRADLSKLPITWKLQDNSVGVPESVLEGEETAVNHPDTGDVELNPHKYDEMEASFPDVSRDIWKAFSVHEVMSLLKVESHHAYTVGQEILRNSHPKKLFLECDGELRADIGEGGITGGVNTERIQAGIAKFNSTKRKVHVVLQDDGNGATLKTLVEFSPELDDFTNGWHPFTRTSVAGSAYSPFTAPSYGTFVQSTDYSALDNRRYTPQSMLNVFMYTISLDPSLGYGSRITTRFALVYISENYEFQLRAEGLTCKIARYIKPSASL